MRTVYLADVYSDDRVTLVKSGVACHIATMTPPSDLARPLMDINTVGTHVIAVSNTEKATINPDYFFKIEDNWYRILKSQSLIEQFSPRQIRCLCRMAIDE